MEQAGGRFIDRVRKSLPSSTTFAFVVLLGGIVLSTWQFHTGHVVAAFFGLGLVVALAATLAATRSTELVTVLVITEEPQEKPRTWDGPPQIF